MAGADALCCSFLAFYPEVRVLIVALILNVLFDNFVRYVAARNAEVSTRPDMATPEFLLKMWELLHQLEGTLPLERLHEPADGDARREAHEQMNVIFRDVPLDNRHLVVAADFADQFPNSEADLPGHGRLAVLRDPDDVEVDAEDCMRAVPVLSHGAQFSTRRKTR